jgi:hypothetical protein
MAEGRVELEWNQTSALLALIANCHRDPKKAPLEPEYFNPTVKPKPLPKVGVGILKDIFLSEKSGPTLRGS